jgi:hypothetical protein
MNNRHNKNQFEVGQNFRIISVGISIQVFIESKHRTTDLSQIILQYNKLGGVTRL